MTNRRVNGAMYLACAGNSEAIAVLVQHAQDDPLEKNAFILFEMLKKKFTNKTDERLQVLVNQLNTLDALSGKDIRMYFEAGWRIWRTQASLGA